MDKIRSTPALANNTLVFYTTDNGAWQDVYPDAGYTPFRGTKGTVREGGNRVPAIAWMPGRIAANAKNLETVGGLDLMATFAAIGGVKLPENDRAGQPIIFDSFDISPVLFGRGPSPRTSWFYFTEDELTPGAPASATTRPCSTCAATTARRPAASRSTPTSAGNERRNTSPPSRRCSTCGRTRRSATTSS